MWVTILSFFKRITKNIKWYHIVIIIALLAIGTSIYYYNRAKTWKQEAKRMELNYDSYVEDTRYRMNKKEQRIAERDVVVLKYREMLNSRDSAIQSILKNLESNDIKLRNVESALSVQLEINEELKSKVGRDTVFVNVGDSIIYKIREIDSIQVASLKVKRIKVVGEDSASYKISYRPILYVSIDKYKEGKWKFINLFKWRDKIRKVTVNSNDKILNPKEIIYIEQKGKR